MWRFHCLGAHSEITQNVQCLQWLSEGLSCQLEWSCGFKLVNQSEHVFFLPKIMSQIKEQFCVYGEMKDREYISWSSHCFINTVAIKFLHGQDSALYFRLLNFLILELVKNFIV